MSGTGQREGRGGAGEMGYLLGDRARLGEKVAMEGGMPFREW